MCMFAAMELTKELLDQINTRIAMLGIKKAHLAKRMGIDSVRYSQVMSGKRKLQPSEYKELKDCLGLS